MLRIKPNTSPRDAKKYFRPDYYVDGHENQELPGCWRGKGAARLGLSGPVDPKAWAALCDNLDPRTERPLTVRQRQDRTVGYDFNFQVGKSLSLLYAQTMDPRILDAFQKAVHQSMNEIEAEMQTRVRLGGKDEDRITGNMVWGEFIHLTSRPVDGIPDPLLHAHCFVFNSTYDSVEQRWKAGQFRELKRDAPYFQARFHADLARRIQDLGIELGRTKNGWEVAGIGKTTRDKFSRRTAVIEKMAKEKGITSAAEKDGLGAITREKKQKNLSMKQLREQWRSWLDDSEMAAMDRVAGTIGNRPIADNPKVAETAAELAIEHCFERKSVVAERVVLAEAINRAVGQTTAAQVEAAVQRQNLIWAERDGRRFVTTREVLAEEKRMLDFAREGRGTCRRLGSGSHSFKREQLNEGQRKAVLHVLTSSDRVILIRGGAGTGKTTMMQEAVEAIEATGIKVFTFAPSAAASRGVLASEGFKDSETVARLLKDEKLQEQIRGAAVWVDEAGLLGVKAMAELFELADRMDARVVLSGDHHQHGSVERGAALRLLETEAGLIPAQLRDIQRQTGAYKQAVRALSEGRIGEGFEQLNKLGWIKQVPDEQRYQAIAADYLATVAAGKSALVISPTHAELDKITLNIRDALKQQSQAKKSKGRKKAPPALGRDERNIPVLRNANLTEGERADSVNYNPGDVLVFNQNGKGFKKGQRVTVDDVPLPLDQAARFSAFRTGQIKVATGELLRVTQNGKTLDGHRLNNGQIITVKKFTERGDMVLTNGWTVSKDFGFLSYGYAVTSHASQSRTVDRVFLGQSADSFPASRENQFYVSISRAREKATVYTSDKSALLRAVCRSDERLSATEFVNERQMRDHVAAVQRMQRNTVPHQAPTIPAPSRQEIHHER